MTIREARLFVKDAKKRDIGRGIARVNDTNRKRLGVKIGDTIEIVGKKSTVATIRESYELDKKQNIIRIDSYIRENANLSVGEWAIIRKVSKKANAKYVEIAPIGMRLEVDNDFTNFIKGSLIERVLVEDDTSPIMMLGHAIPFKVAKTKPRGIVEVTPETKVKILKNPLIQPKLAEGLYEAALEPTVPSIVPYEIYLPNLPEEYEGLFNCPSCGNVISPEDESGENYEIIETKLRNEELESIIVRCRKCGTLIDLTGFLYTPPRKEEIEKEYEKLKPFYKALLKEIRFILVNRLKNSEIRIHNVTTRVKNFNSLYEKIIRKKIEEDPFEAINDIAALRVICLYRDDLEKIREIIAKNFKIIKASVSRVRSEKHFGYMSDHYVVNLHKKYRGPRYDEIKRLKCEIQVRTILMHAWASVSHHLDYKKNIDIPKSLRKDFAALSGLFYVADSHFESLRKGIEKVRSKLIESADQDKFDLAQEINLDSLRIYLEWKLPNRKEGNVDSTLLEDIEKVGFNRFTELEERLIEHKSEVERKEKDQWGQTVLTREDMARLSLGIPRPRYRKFLM